MAGKIFQEDRRRMDELIAELDLIEDSYVITGFLEGSVTKSQSKGGRLKKAGSSIPQIAAWNEFGTEHIPARPFMSTSFDENRERIDKAIAGEYSKIIDGTSTVRKSLNLLGLFMTDLIQTKIRNIHYPPNSPRTIAAKKSSKPLIDFGQMIQSVTHQVVIQ